MYMAYQLRSFCLVFSTLKQLILREILLDIKPVLNFSAQFVFQPFTDTTYF
jgi:hypothetical protein